jgi:1-aminocyclopropane-1-carboxylate deaminase
MLLPSLNKSRVNTVSLYKSRTSFDVLRLDLVHPVISGNKWFKLRKYIEEAQQLGNTTLLTYGGAYSNHIVATAAAAQETGLKSIGIIKSHLPGQLSQTLQDASAYGMQLFFAPDKDKEQAIVSSLDADNIYYIPMGGYGLPGKEGAKTILDEVNLAKYTHIICAVGTGTMLAGLAEAALSHQHVVGISSMKNNFSLEDEIKQLLHPDKHQKFQLIYDYHFGGFAKRNAELIGFMNDWYQHSGIPTDIVYTGKLFFGVNDLYSKEYFPLDASLLVIHSGGLQGNRSLPAGTLIFGPETT